MIAGSIAGVLRAAGAMTVVLALRAAFAMAEDAGPGKIEHYRTVRLVSGQVIQTDHIKMKGVHLTMEASPAWVPVPGNGTGLLWFEHRTESGVRLVVRRVLLKETPGDPTAASKRYEREIAAFPGPRFIKDARPPEFDLPGSFPQSYILAASEMEPPTQIHTFFIHPPCLYDVSLEVPHLLFGNLRLEYRAFLKSLRLEETDANAVKSTALSP